MAPSSRNLTRVGGLSSSILRTPSAVEFNVNTAFSKSSSTFVFHPATKQDVLSSDSRLAPQLRKLHAAGRFKAVGGPSLLVDLVAGHGLYAPLPQPKKGADPARSKVSPALAASAAAAAVNAASRTSSESVALVIPSPTASRSSSPSVAKAEKKSAKRSSKRTASPDDSESDAESLIEEVAVGALLGAYRSPTYGRRVSSDADDEDVEVDAASGRGGRKGKKSESDVRTAEHPDPFRCKEVSIVASGVDAAVATRAAARAAAGAAGCYLSRDLGHAPPNVATPAAVAKLLLEEWRDLSPYVSVDILPKGDLTKIGAHAMLAVGEGSENESHMVVATLHPVTKGSRSKGKVSSTKRVRKGESAEDDSEASLRSLLGRSVGCEGGGADARTIALVGKGVTMDTGGINVKPYPHCTGMKYDMCGAAAVAGAFTSLALLRAAADGHTGALARLGLGRKGKGGGVSAEDAVDPSVKVVAVLGFVENMPDGRAYKPCDVVSSLSKRTIEVLNTDAEGRLVLADCITFAQKYAGATTVVDVATLTGAVVVALGETHAGLFSNKDPWWGVTKGAVTAARGAGGSVGAEDRVPLPLALMRAGACVGEQLWPLPLNADKAIESKWADVKNVGAAGESGSSAAACFLQKFVEEGTEWAHLDIAGTAMNKKTALTYGGVENASWGVRTLQKWVTEYSRVV